MKLQFRKTIASPAYFYKSMSVSRLSSRSVRTTSAESPYKGQMSGQPKV